MLSFVSLCVCTVSVAMAVTPAQPSQDSRLVLLDAMSAELSRNHKELKLDTHEAPYFISYQMKDYDQFEIGARFGALFQDAKFRDRKLYVDVRVGDYQFDNSRDEDMDFSFSPKGQSYVSPKNGPIDDDPTALRTALWLVTDEKYKNALVNYLKKKGERVYSVADPKEPPSFTKEKSSSEVQPAVPFSFDRPRWTSLAQKLSARFKAFPQVFDSEVRINADKIVRYFVSTEGTRLVTEDVLYAVHVNALTRSEDGQLLDNSRDYYSPTEAGLPSDAELDKRVDEMVRELLALRQAPAIDPYTGPAILASEAAGVLFHEAVGHRLEGERQNSQVEGKTFKGQVGMQMLPTFLTIEDDPTQKTINGTPLNGYYRFDEEGVPGKKTTLIENGVLRNYLLSRQPVEGFSQSNGHGRSQGNRRPMARMANLIVHSKKQVSEAELKKKLIAEAKRQGKPYGLIIRDITGGNTNTSNYGYQAFKGVPRMVYRVDVRDGKETLVRGVEIVGTPLSSVNRILATGTVQGVFNGFCGAESGNVPVSAVAPATLLQEIELQRAVEGKDRPPILSNPFAAGKGAP